MRLTRRMVFNGAAGTVGALIATSRPWRAIVSPAAAETRKPDVAIADLMDPGPLPDRFLGSEQAPVTIVEYASMTCTHCAQFAISTFPELKTKYIETGKVRYTMREFALDQYAAVGHMLARASGDNYFAVIDVLMREQRRWANNYVQPLMTLAIEQFGFTADSFRACLANRKLLADIKAAYLRGEKLGVASVPTCFVNGRKYSGFLSIAELDDVIAPHLKV